MKFDDNGNLVISAFNQDPSNPRNSYELGALFWSSISKQVGAIIRNGGNVDDLIDNEKDFINFGLHPGIREDADNVRDAVFEAYLDYKHLKIELLTDWLSTTITEITEGNRKDLIQQDIRNEEIQLKRLENEISMAHEAREELLKSLLANGSPEAIHRIIGQISQLKQVDQLQRASLKRKRQVAKGAFFSVEERRNFVQQEKQLQKGMQFYEALVSQVRSPKDRATLHEHTKKLTELITKALAGEEAIEHMYKEIEDIETKQEAISPGEMENRTLGAIEYVRDLVKLCAKRLRAESCSFIRPEEKFFTLRELVACLDRVLEFDPKILCNDRINYLGKPSILLVPGNGNALYDWKNNQFIVPLCPPGGNFMGSIATAMIEYRLDVDEDKNLINSYWKLPAHKQTKSTFQLKASLTRDYITWMSAEYKGFRVLPKETKKWFEYEVAPNRNEIYCPPEYQPFSLSAKEFQELLNETEEKLKDKELSECEEQDLWVGSILTYQKGEYQRSYECVSALLTKSKQYRFGQYNLGHIGMKVSQKQQAIAGFNEFANAYPQSWWASVARDYVRRLQMA